MRKEKGQHQDAAAYGLGVLDDSGDFESHLSDCSRCRAVVAEFATVAGALERALALGYLPPGDGSANRKRPCPLGRARMRSGTGKLLLLTICLSVAAMFATCPEEDRSGWVESAANIVSPAQVVAGSGAVARADLLDLPWSAGFQ